MKIAVIIPTYYREDGETIMNLVNIFSCLSNQTYQNYHIFLIGDDYKQQYLYQIQNLINSYPNLPITFKNLLLAKERSKYSADDLWRTGGVNATNIGIQMALEKKIEWCCCLDHDDMWDTSHLEELSNCLHKYPDIVFMCTKSTHFNYSILPSIDDERKYIEYKPEPNALIKSSTCFKINDIRFRDVVKENISSNYAADGYFWKEYREWMEVNKLGGKLINVITCQHNEEGYIKQL